MDFMQFLWVFFINITSDTVNNYLDNLIFFEFVSRTKSLLVLYDSKLKKEIVNYFYKII